MRKKKFVSFSGTTREITRFACNRSFRHNSRQQRSMLKKRCSSVMRPRRIIRECKREREMRENGRMRWERERYTLKTVTISCLSYTAVRNLGKKSRDWKEKFSFFFFSIFLNYYNRRGGEKKEKKSANAQSLRDWWYSDESMFSPETSNNVIENRGLIVEASPLLSNFFSEDSNFSKKCRRTF